MPDTPTSSARAAAPSSPPLVPASWAGFGALLGSAGERVPAEALTLAVAADRAPGQSAAVDLSGIWALPAAVAPVRGHALLRTLDSKGRLQLPVTRASAAMLPAERDGALVVVFLPGADRTPRAGFTATPLPLDARGRHTLTAGVRAAAGIADRADLLAYLDRDARTVTITAASRLDTALAAALDILRRTASQSSGHRPSESANTATNRPTVATCDPSPRSNILDCAASAEPDHPTRPAHTAPALP